MFFCMNIRFSIVVLSLVLLFGVSVQECPATSFYMYDDDYALVDLETGDRLVLPLDTEPKCFSPDGTRFVTVNGKNETATLFGWKDGVHWSFPLEDLPKEGRVGSIVFSPDSACFAIGVTDYPRVNKPRHPSSFYVYSAETGKPLVSLKGISEKAIRWQPVFHPNGTDLIVGSEIPDKTRVVHILAIGPSIDVVSHIVKTARIDYRTNRVLWETPHRFLELSADGNRILTCDQNRKTIYCLSADTGKVLWKTEGDEARFIENGKWVVTELQNVKKIKTLFKTSEKIEDQTAVIETESGRLVWRKDAALSAHSEENDYFVLRDGAGTLLKIMKGEKELWRVEKTSSQFVQLISSGKYCVISGIGSRSTSDLYETATGNKIRTISDVDFFKIFAVSEHSYLAENDALVDLVTGETLRDWSRLKEIPLHGPQSKPWKFYDFVDHGRKAVLRSSRPMGSNHSNTAR